MDDKTSLRLHLSKLLDSNWSHINMVSALSDFPMDSINESIGDSLHTPWQLLEHIRIAQRDILDFSRNPDYQEMKWPDDYWPKARGTRSTWNTSVGHVWSDLDEMKQLVADEKTDLFATIPWGSGQTILREAMVVADHNAYHLGQLVLLKKMISK